MAALDPIPRHMSLAHRGLGPTPDDLAFRQRISETLVQALGLPTLEEVRAGYLGDPSTPFSRLLVAEREAWRIRRDKAAAEFVGSSEFKALLFRWECPRPGP